jgi:hypothetical protein
MTAAPYTRLDAAHLLGALDADKRLAYEAHRGHLPTVRTAFAAGRDGAR